MNSRKEISSILLYTGIGLGQIGAGKKMGNPNLVEALGARLGESVNLGKEI